MQEINPVMKNTVKYLVDANKEIQDQMKLSFVSNNDLVLRQQYAEQLVSNLEVAKNDITQEQVYTSAYLGAKYISTKYPETKKVRVVGMNSIVGELEA